MSDHHQNPHNKNETEPEVENTSPMTETSAPIQRSSKRSNHFIAIVMLIIACGVGFVLYRGFTNNNQQQSRVTRPPNVESIPGGAQQARSPRYQQTLDAANEAGAREAGQTSESFIATPDQTLRSIDNIGNKPSQPVIQRPVAPPNIYETPPEHVTDYKAPIPQPQNDFRRINDLAAMMSAQQQGLLNAWSPKPSQATVVIEQTLYVDPDIMKPADASNPDHANIITANSIPLITAGQTIMARLVNASDSDTPGPVVADIIGGPLDKARAIGQFGTNKNQNALVIQFEKITLPDGTTIGTSAYAVDAQTASIAVKTDINHRYIQRYGLRLAAAFIGGLSEALSTPQETFVPISSEIGSIVTKQPSITEGLFSGVAKVGNKLSEDMDQHAPNGPLVKMRAGQLIGILFLDNVMPKKQ